MSMSENEQVPDAVRGGAEAAEEEVTTPDSRSEPDPQPASRGDLGASENAPLLHPNYRGQEGEPRQPRPDEVESGEPLGAPEDPLTKDPRRHEGDAAEDEM